MSEEGRVAERRNSFDFVTLLVVARRADFGAWCSILCYGLILLKNMV